MADFSTVKVETAFDVTAYLKAEDDDRLGSNLTKLFMPGFAIFGLYLLIGSAALYPIFSKEVRNLLEKNLIARHILGFFSLLFFIVLSGAQDVQYLHTLLFTAFLYLWFLLTTRLNLTFWLITMFVFATLFSLQLYKQTKDLPHWEKKILTEIEYVGTAIGFATTLYGYVFYSKHF
jgi:hypothetical protein